MIRFKFDWGGGQMERERDKNSSQLVLFSLLGMYNNLLPLFAILRLISRFRSCQCDLYIIKFSMSFPLLMMIVTQIHNFIRNYKMVTFLILSFLLNFLSLIIRLTRNKEDTEKAALMLHFFLYLLVLRIKEFVLQKPPKVMNKFLVYL